MWKVWPLIKDNAVAKKALEIVHEMEETYGHGYGEVKFENAVNTLQTWLNGKGIQLNLNEIMRVVTAAVGMLHAEQGVVPVYGDEEDNEEEDAEEADEAGKTGFECAEEEAFAETVSEAAETDTTET